MIHGWDSNRQHVGVSINKATPIRLDIEMDDLGVPPSQEPPIWLYD